MFTIQQFRTYLYILLLVLCLSAGAAAVHGDSENVSGLWTKTQILEQMEKETDVSVAAFNEGDYAKSAAIYHLQGYVLAHQLPVISSQSGIVDMLSGMGGGGMQYGYMKKYNQQIWESGKYVYELYDYQVKVTLSNRAQPLFAMNRDLSIWEKSPDGQIKIRVDIWSKATVSGKQPAPIDPNSMVTQFYSVSPQPVINPVRKQTSALNKIKQLDLQFHQSFIKKDIDTFLDFYADDFTLVRLDKPNLTSITEMRKSIEQNLDKLTVLDNGQKIIFASISGKMAFIVNSYHWELKNADGSIQEIPGKGVHVWKQNNTGDWKLLIDIYNTDVQMN